MFTEAASKAIAIVHINNRWRYLSSFTLRLYSLHFLDRKVREPRTGFEIKSIFLWRWYIKVTITILNIIHRPVFYLKHDISETGFYYDMVVWRTNSLLAGIKSFSIRHAPVFVKTSRFEYQPYYEITWLRFLWGFHHILRANFVRGAFIFSNKTKTTSVVWVRERTIPTNRQPLVGEVSANFLRIEGAKWSAWLIPTAVFSVPRPDPSYSQIIIYYHITISETEKSK
jgi:hypothetical protein